MSERPKPYRPYALVHRITDQEANRLREAISRDLQQCSNPEKPPSAGPVLVPSRGTAGEWFHVLNTGPDSSDILVPPDGVCDLELLEGRDVPQELIDRIREQATRTGILLDEIDFDWHRDEIKTAIEAALTTAVSED